MAACDQEIAVFAFLAERLVFLAGLVRYSGAESCRAGAGADWANAKAGVKLDLKVGVAEKQSVFVNEARASQAVNSEDAKTRRRRLFTLMVPEGRAKGEG